MKRESDPPGSGLLAAFAWLSFAAGVFFFVLWIKSRNGAEAPGWIAAAFALWSLILTVLHRIRYPGSRAGKWLTGCAVVVTLAVTAFVIYAWIACRNCDIGCSRFGFERC